MGKVIKAPIVYRHKRTVRGKEIYSQREPSDAMVWEVCPYIRSKFVFCEHCPRWRPDPDADDPRDEGERIKDGCRAKAEEACRVVFAMLKREIGL